jgi:hypothetical protein
LNATALDNVSQLIPVPNPDTGEFPPDGLFPDTYGDIWDMDEHRVNRLLCHYGITLARQLSDQRRQLAQFIGCSVPLDNPANELPTTQNKMDQVPAIIGNGNSTTDRLNAIMDSFTAEEKAQFSPAQKIVLELLDERPPKPTIQLSSATLWDCKRPDGLALNYRNVEDFGFVSFRVPTDYPCPPPSDLLIQSLDRIMRVWTLSTEKACRTLTDAILTEAVWSHPNQELEVFCQVNNDWEGQGVKYSGTADYMIGTMHRYSVESHILVMEAKIEWAYSDIPRVLAEAGCLLKRRLEAGQKTPIFALLTNGRRFYRFFCD